MSVEALSRLEKQLEKDINDMRFIVDSIGKELHARVDKLDAKVDTNDEKLREKLLGKVGWKQFYVMVSFLVALFIGISGILYSGQKETVTTMYALFERQDNKIDKVRDTVGTTQQDVSLMKGLLKNAEISN